MKRSLPLLIVPFGFAAALALAPMVASAQTSGGAGATAAAAKLAPGDKAAFKSMADAHLGVMHVTDIFDGMGVGGTEPVQTLGKGMSEEAKGGWAELEILSNSKGGELPKTEPSAMDKRTQAELKKTPGDKFDKAFLKAVDKEVRKAAGVCAAAAKTAADPEIKAFAAKWQKTWDKYKDDVNKTEAEVGKKK